MGRSRGVLTTKIHALVDTEGRPIRLKLTEGQAHYGRSAADMFETLKAGHILLADRAYDSDALTAYRQPPLLAVLRALESASVADTAGVRVVVDLKRDASPEVVLNQIWRYTPAQASFPANMLAIRGGRPEVLTLRDFVQAFIGFREDVITRRTKFELNKARERAHVLVGLAIAVANIDEVIQLIRNAPNPQRARATAHARAGRCRSPNCRL